MAIKKTLFLFITFLSVLFVNAQKDPVSWTFTSKKISDKVYEVHMKASINSGWHLYSQTQPADAIAIPTKFVFTNNPLLKTEGSVKEVGKMQKFKDATLGVEANQFATTVDFVQKVTLKAAANTNIAGTVTYQTCDDKQCLPPKKVPFKIALK